MRYQEKVLALSTLQRRDRKDPGAIPLLQDLLRDSSRQIRRKALDVSQRYLHSAEIVQALFLTASSRSELPELRKNALDKLANLMDKPDSEEQLSQHLFHSETILFEWLHRLVQSNHEPLTIRTKALEMYSSIKNSEKIDHWILYFHSRSESFCKISSIYAMGNSDSDQWKNYLQEYVRSDNMEYRCAALEALAPSNQDPEDPTTDPHADPASSRATM